MTTAAGASPAAATRTGAVAVAGAAGRPVARLALGFVIPVALVVIWFLITIPGASLVAPYQFPSPGAVLQAGVELQARGELVPFILISLQRVFVGFAFGAVLGIAVGGVVGLSRWWDAALTPFLGVIRAVPSLAWVPLLIVWFQAGEQSKIILIAIGAFFPVFTTVSLALRHVDPQLVELGRTFGRRGIRLFFTVHLPSVLPSVFAGLRLALVQAWLFLVAAELLGASMGLGFLLSRGSSNGRVDQIVVAIILLAVLGKLTDVVLAAVQHWAARRWG